MAQLSKISGDIKGFLQYHFGDSSRIEDDNLTSYTYPDNIRIVVGAQEDYDYVSHTPAVYVANGKLQSNLINSMFDYSVTVGGVERLSNDMVDMEAGAVNIICESQYRAVSRSLAYEIYDYIKKLTGILAEDFNLYYIYPVLSPEESSGGQENRPRNIFTVSVQWIKFNAWSHDAESSVMYLDGGHADSTYERTIGGGGA